MDTKQSSAANLSESGRIADLNELFERYRSRLKLMVHLRIDRRLQARIDSSDVLQEAFLEAATRYEQYRASPSMPPFLWLRFLVGQQLVLMHRRHLGVKARAASREVSLFRGALPEANSQSLAAALLGKLSSPSQAAIRCELQVRLQEALNSMDVIDREVLVLRHFEQLSNVETAQVLGLEERAASKRYITALRRLKDALSGMQGFFDS
jgi:RNA polymerase sigma-70 factor (ECF subfamily)